MADILIPYIKEYADVSRNGSVMSVIFKETTSPMHKAKVHVMLAMNNFLQNPTEQTWQDLQTAKTNNKGWDKGFFSTRVSTRMKEVEKFYKAAQEEDIGVFSPPTKGK